MNRKQLAHKSMMKIITSFNKLETQFKAALKPVNLFWGYRICCFSRTCNSPTSKDVIK